MDCFNKRPINNNHKFYKNSFSSAANDILVFMYIPTSRVFSNYTKNMTVFGYTS